MKTNTPGPLSPMRLMLHGLSKKNAAAICSEVDLKFREIVWQRDECLDALEVVQALAPAKATHIHTVISDALATCGRKSQFANDSASFAFGGKS